MSSDSGPAQVPEERDEPGISTEAARKRPWLILALGALGLILATALQVARQPGTPATDTIWAEDGFIFLSSALLFPDAAEVFVAPAGKYLHAAPRTLGFIASSLSLDSAAPFFALASSLTVAVLAGYVFMAARPWIPRWPGRLVVAAMMPLLPVALLESLNNSANLHYFLSFAAFWALLAIPAGWPGVVAGASVAGVAALSDPIAVLLAPIAGWTLLRRPDRRRVVVAAVFLIAIGTHGLVWLTADRADRYEDPRVTEEVERELHIRAFAPQTYAPSHPEELPRLYGLRVAGVFFVGYEMLAPAYRRFGDVFSYAALAAVGLMAAYAVARREIPRAVLGLTLAYSVLFFLVPVAIRGTEHVAPVDEQVIYAGSRYAVVPTLLLISSAAILLSRRDRRVPGRTWSVVVVGTMTLLVAIVVNDFRYPNPRAEGPPWSEELSSATRLCRETGWSYVKIPIAPKGAGWDVLVGCDRLLSEAR